MILPGRDLAGASGARQYVTVDQIARKCTGKQVTRLIVTSVPRSSGRDVFTQVSWQGERGTKSVFLCKVNMDNY
jgi:hypothetical protein